MSVEELRTKNLKGLGLWEIRVLQIGEGKKKEDRD